MTVDPMTDVDRIRAQWVDDLRRAVTVSKHDKHMQVSPLQVACLFKALDAERTRADAAEAERDAALARLGALIEGLGVPGNYLPDLPTPTAAQETPDAG